MNVESFSPEKEIFMTQTRIEIQNQISIKKYQELLKQLKEKIQISQVKAALSINCELIQLYWEIGTSIQAKQEEEGWGSKTIDNLARDLKCEFPDIKGFSRTNINYMVQFAKEYPDKEIVQQLVGHIPWGHNVVLFQRVNDKEERFWYISKTITNGWSRKILAEWIDKQLYKRKGKALTNFQKYLQ
jgi:predicted nuclease of restriction endonuclease-like (RecB) superfamily